VSEAKPGESVKVEIWRKGSTLELTAVLGKSELASTDDSTNGKAQTHGRLGLAVRALTAEERSEAKVPGGLLVEGVAGAAERAGVQAGDIILSVNGTALKSAAQLHDFTARASKSIALLVQRGDARIFVPIKTG
jgi:serine protease Do